MRRPIADIIAGYQRNASLARRPRFPRSGTRTRACWTWSAGRCSRVRGRLRVGLTNFNGRASTSPAKQRPANRSSWSAAATRSCAASSMSAAITPRPWPPSREGSATHLRCPYHGWTYSLEGELKGTPDFAGVCNFDRSSNGLVPVETGVWENWVFVRVEREGPSLAEFLGADLKDRFSAHELGGLQWMERRSYFGGLQLEGLRRQLSRRRVSRPTPAQRARQRPRLQHVHHRKRGSLLPAVEPDGRRWRRCQDRRGADRRTRPLLLGVSEFHDQLLRGRDGHQPRDPARPGPHRGHLRFLLRGCDARPPAPAISRASRSASRFSRRTSRSARPCSAACTRARTQPAGSRSGAKPASTSFTSCSTTI